MLSALSYLHSNGIVHRDIKLENFVFTGPSPGEGTIKMIDFGLSRACLEAEAISQNVGSVVYKAPEIYTGSYSEVSAKFFLCFGSGTNLVGSVYTEQKLPRGKVRPFSGGSVTCARACACACACVCVCVFVSSDVGI